MDVTALRRRSAELGFTPQDQVRWLSPVELARTAVIAGLGSLFAGYTDRRETQAALPASALALPADPDGGVWWDYLADTGDGFDPTYTMVSLLAAPQVDVAGADRAVDAMSLPRGRALVLGGDEVYPVPSSSNYENRLKALMRAAWAPGALAPGEREPVVYALPGNHDWYDGLTAFLRVFAQRRMVGGWRSEQTRSYFAVRLPAKWWLVGVDTQLGSYLDGPQLEDFRRNLAAHLEPGDGVIVCAPAPSWAHTAEDDPDAFNSLHFFEHEVVRNRTDDAGVTTPTGAGVRLWLSGDRHHYARYAEQAPGRPPRQLVTCGLGGAYLGDTHRLPEQLVLPTPCSTMASPDQPAAFDLVSRWPHPARSRRFARRVLGGPPHGLAFRNPGLWRLVGGVHAAALLLQAFVLGLVQGSSPVSVLRTASPVDALDLGWQTAVWLSVGLAVAVLLPVLRGRPPRRPGAVLVAVVLQLAVANASFAAVLAVPWSSSWPDWVVLGVAVGGTVLGTGLVGCQALAAYILASRDRTVASWQMSAQSVEEYKGFLRIRVDADGRLTVYPLAVETVCHDWDVVVDAAAAAQPGVRARPVPARTLPVVRLIEPPVVVER